MTERAARSFDRNAQWLFPLPVVILTLAIQRYIVSGLTMGAVKG